MFAFIDPDDRELLFFFRYSRDKAIEQAVELVLAERKTGQRTVFEFARDALR